MERSPTRDRFRRSDRYYRDRFYRDRFYDPFFYSPFFYDPFYRDPWGRYSVPEYGSRDDWSDRQNIQLNVEPRDVEVIVDGIPTAKGGRAFLNLPSGPHHIAIIRSGYRPWVLDLDVKQGVRYRLEQRLERLSKEEQERGEDRPTADRFGELRLTVRPEDAIVHLDGRLLGIANLLRGSEALQRLPMGRHTLRFTRPGYKAVEREITVTADRPVEVTVDLERD